MSNLSNQQFLHGLPALHSEPQFLEAQDDDEVVTESAPTTTPMAQEGDDDSKTIVVSSSNKRTRFKRRPQALKTKNTRGTGQSPLLSLPNLHHHQY